MSPSTIEGIPSRQYCIKRSNGQIVPLIEADRLPNVPELRDFPRTLTTNQAFDWGFVRVDAAQHANFTVPASTSRVEDEVDETHRQLRRGVKVWCSKWLDTRDCAFQQQGCRYKHTIPPRALWPSLGYPNGRPWWRQEAPHMFRSDHIQSILARVRRSSGARSDPRPQPPLFAGRPRVPAVLPSAETSPLSTSSRTLVASTDRDTKRNSLESINLIDLDDDMPDQTMSTSSSTSSSDDTQAPAQKKTKLDSNVAQPSSAPAVRPFIPAGEDVQKHVAEAQAYAGRHRPRGHCHSRSKRKVKPAAKS